MCTSIRKVKTGILYGTIFLEKFFILIKSFILNNVYEKKCVELL